MAPTDMVWAIRSTGSITGWVHYFVWDEEQEARRALARMGEDKSNNNKRELVHIPRKEATPAF